LISEYLNVCRCQIGAAYFFCIILRYLSFEFKAKNSCQVLAKIAEMFLSISTIVLLLSNVLTIAASQNIPLTRNQIPGTSHLRLRATAPSPSSRSVKPSLYHREQLLSLQHLGIKRSLRIILFGLQIHTSYQAQLERALPICFDSNTRVIRS
jgi:hypothetical protein